MAEEDRLDEITNLFHICTRKATQVMGKISFPDAIDITNSSMKRTGEILKRQGFDLGAGMDLTLLFAVTANDVLGTADTEEQMLKLGLAASINTDLAEEMIMKIFKIGFSMGIAVTLEGELWK